MNRDCKHYSECIAHEVCEAFSKVKPQHAEYGREVKKSLCPEDITGCIPYRGMEKGSHVNTPELFKAVNYLILANIIESRIEKLTSDNKA